MNLDHYGWLFYSQQAPPELTELGPVLKWIESNSNSEDKFGIWMIHHGVNQFSITWNSIEKGWYLSGWCSKENKAEVINIIEEEHPKIKWIGCEAA